MVNSITPQQFEPAFDIAKAMREGRLDTSQALERIVENGFSHSSATMYLNALYWSTQTGHFYLRILKLYR